MSCFGGKDAQIYMLEITVDRLKLSAVKFNEELSDCWPTIKIRFLDFPVLTVNRRGQECSDVGAAVTALRLSEGSADPRTRYNENEGLVYVAGRSCLFVKKPRDLVAAMKATPLRIGIFKGEETFPIADTTIPLSGCLCDQVAMVGNDSANKPKPYELIGSYDLCDPGKNPAGSITIFLRLTFFGPHIISQFQLFDDFCVFKNDYDAEYCLTRINEDNPDDYQDHFKFCDGTVLGALRHDKDFIQKPNTTHCASRSNRSLNRSAKSSRSNTSSKRY